METKAILMMVITESIIAFVTVRFFWKVLTAKKRPEPDSYSGNDPK